MSAAFRLNRHVLAALVAALLLAGTIPAMAAPPPNLPDPKGYVNDFAGVLKPDEVARLTKLITDNEKATSAEIAIVTIKTTLPYDVKDYAVALMEKWKVGKAGKDNGVILLAAIDDRRVSIEVGYGLEGALTDAITGRILDNDVLPAFRNNKYGDGLIAATNSMVSLIVKEDSAQPLLPRPAQPPKAAPVPATVPRSTGIPFSPFIAIGVILLGAIAIVGAVARSRPKCPKCKGKCIVTERIVQPATALSAGIGMRKCTCPDCGFTEETEYRIPPIMVFGGGRRGGWGGFGGGFGGGGGGGFGGFGGGGSGGGGSSRSW